MPSYNTKFNKTWLSEIDSNGDEIGKWCKPGTGEFSFYCIFCNPAKELSCANRGREQLTHHVKTEKHIKLSRARKTQCQLAFNKPKKNETTVKDLDKSSHSSQNSPLVSSKETPSASTSKAQDETQDETSILGYLIPKEKAIEAEIIWMFHIAVTNESYRSCDGLINTFCAMFPDSQIASQMSLSKSKASYIISDGLGPILLKQLAADVSDSMYTVHYDEATGVDGTKQLDMHLRYWSKTLNEVVVAFFKGVKIGHGTGAIISQEIITALSTDGVNLRNFLTVSHDGPNVNKTVFRLLNNEMNQVRKKPLLDVGTCSLHIAHNGFSKGLEAYGQHLPELAIDLHSFLKLSSARKEDLKDIQTKLDLDQYVMLRFVSTRWVSLAKVLQRIKDQMSAIVMMFKTCAQSNPQPKSQAYKRIQLQLTRKETLMVEMEFIIAVSKDFEEFLLFFQSSEPLIHVLRDKMMFLIRKLMHRCIKPEKITEKLTDIDLSESEIYSSDADMTIGHKTKEALIACFTKYTIISIFVSGVIFYWTAVRGGLQISNVFF